MEKIVILTKIHYSEYINDMYENEYLYFKPLIDFRSSSNDKSGRLDPKELNITNIQLNNLTITAKGKTIEFHKMFKEFSGQFMSNLSDPKTNCCSLHWMELESGKENSSFDKRLLDFGDKVLLITDCDKFIEILDESIEKLNYQYKREKVSYYSPKKFNGKLSLHQKDEKYEYQNEYRILISPTENKPINIPLPGLKEISLIMNSSDLNKLMVK